ncbi:MAG TPA: Ig-like domain-containing protein [Myxococcaceae bacterium]|jgi:hypothetical protein
MKRLLPFAAAGLAIGYGVACIDFDQSQQTYCQGLSCHERAVVCADGPVITKMEPDKNATGVALDSKVTVTYDRTVYCSGGTGVALVQYTGGEPPVPGTANCSGNNTSVFTPSVALLSGRVYKVYVHDCQVADDAGVGALETSWTFTTR